MPEPLKRDTSPAQAPEVSDQEVRRQQLAREFDASLALVRHVLVQLADARAKSPMSTR